MSLDAKITVQDTDGRSGTYPCSTCRGETSQLILGIVNSNDSACDGDVQFWNHYLTVRCNGCGTVNFCLVSSCSEEEDYDRHGRPFLAERKIGFRPARPDDDDCEAFVDASRLSALEAVSSSQFDMTRLIQMLIELDRSYRTRSYLSCIFLVRSILDHVPPIFGLNTFIEIANNYAGGGNSFRKAAQHLQNTGRNIADAHLHFPIRKTEALPSKSQVEFRADLDVLLSEVLRILQSRP